MWFSKADGGLEEVVEAAPTPPLEEDRENGLLWESADFTDAVVVLFSSAIENDFHSSSGNGTYKCEENWLYVFREVDIISRFKCNFGG